MGLNLTNGFFLAQTVVRMCAPSADDMEKGLLKNYGEVPMFQAITSTGHMMQVFVDDNDSSWSMVITHSKTGTTCFYGQGKGYLFLQQAVVGDNT